MKIRRVAPHEGVPCFQDAHGFNGDEAKSYLYVLMRSTNQGEDVDVQ